jgi:hypothetical protein
LLDLELLRGKNLISNAARGLFWENNFTQCTCNSSLGGVTVYAGGPTVTMTNWWNCSTDGYAKTVRSGAPAIVRCLMWDAGDRVIFWAADTSLLIADGVACRDAWRSRCDPGAVLHLRDCFFTVPEFTLAPGVEVKGDIGFNWGLFNIVLRIVSPTFSRGCPAPDLETDSPSEAGMSWTFTASDVIAEPRQRSYLDNESVEEEFPSATIDPAEGRTKTIIVIVGGAVIVAVWFVIVWFGMMRTNVAPTGG